MYYSVVTDDSTSLPGRVGHCLWIRASGPHRRLRDGEAEHLGGLAADVAKARGLHPTYDPPVPPVVAAGPSWNGATTIASLVLSTIAITSCRSGWGTA